METDIECFADREDKTENVESYLIRKYGSLHGAFEHCNGTDGMFFELEMFFKVLHKMVDEEEGRN